MTLSRLLWQTGVAGRPDQFFYEGNEPSWAANDYANYVTGLLETASTPNRVFGAAVMRHDFARFVEKIREELSPTDGQTDAEALDGVMPNLRYLFSTRDVVGQALSWWKARGDGQPSRSGEELPSRDDRARVDERAALMRVQNTAWAQWFSAHSIDPLTVVYDELVGDPEGVVRRVLGYLQVPAPAQLVLEPPELDVPEGGHERQAARTQHLASSRKPPPVSGPRPSRAVFICGMPRSGTALLAGLLASTRLVGPPEEYFKPSNEPSWADDDYDRYVAWASSATAMNGVFGAKFVDKQLWRFLERLRAGSARPDLTDRELLDLSFGDMRFVWLRRQDLVAQAVSWWKAFETDSWWSDGRGDANVAAHELVFDYARIDELVKAAMDGNERWERWFEETGFEPFRLTYEELDADHVGWAKRALSFLEIEVPERVLIRARSVRQADALNEEWAARYRAISAEQMS